MSEEFIVRLERLEQQLAAQRRLTRIFAMSLLCVVVVTVAAGAFAVSQDFDTVTAKKVVIRDSNGKSRIVLEAPLAGPSGDAKIAIRAADGQEICVMGQYSDAIGLFYTQRVAGDAPRAMLYSMTDFAGTDAGGGGGNIPLSMTASKASSALSIADSKDRQPRIDLSVQDESATVSLTDSSGATKYLVQQGTPKSAVTASMSTKVETATSGGVLQFKPKP